MGNIAQGGKPGCSDAAWRKDVYKRQAQHRLTGGQLLTAVQLVAHALELPCNVHELRLVAVLHGEDAAACGAGGLSLIHI